MKPGKNLLAALIMIIAAIACFAIFGIGNKFKGATNMRFGIDIRGGVEAVFEPQNLDRKATVDELETARNIIELRLDSANITDREVTIDKEGGYIIVKFPWKSGETKFNPEDAISELGAMAKLTFQDDEGNVMLEGKNVVKAKAVTNNSQTMKDYEVSLAFDSEGAKLFHEATQKLIGKTLNIYMDDKLISNPQVDEEIDGGEAAITHMKSMEEAQNLAEKINAGALPFSLTTTNFSTISPKLGSNALNIMVIAGIIAFVLVCIFMIIYYKLPGIIACIALLLQMSLQLLSVSLPQYTLTLPGIAGIILSLGMAVDANIIISERISEELKKGLTVKSAITKGYKSAFSAVFDGNLTTAIVAVILMIFGSGTMLSFGYTLLIGMILNLFVGVTVSKKLLMSTLEFPSCNTEKHFRKKKDLKLRGFFEKRRVIALISLGIIIIGVIGVAFRGVKMDVQFKGGVVLNYSCSADTNTDSLENSIGKITDRPVTVQMSENQINKTKSISVTLAGTKGMTPDEQKNITEAINEKLGDKKASLSETYVVQPYIGAKALRNSEIAIALSVIFMIIYVWFRFTSLNGLPAGITAVIALCHDVFVVFITFVLFGIPLNDAYVAVTLTIIGYSINDTIVVYDRIRENRTAEGGLRVSEQVNLAISQTLARSINTSFTTETCVLVMLVSSVLFGINSIIQFALPMFFGLFSGCYSSVCIASILWAMWQGHKEKSNVVN